MMASPGFCLLSLHLTNTGSDVFCFSANEHNIVLMLKEATVCFLKMRTCFLYCSLDGLDE